LFLTSSAAFLTFSNSFQLSLLWSVSFLELASVNCFSSAVLSIFSSCLSSGLGVGVGVGVGVGCGATSSLVPTAIILLIGCFVIELPTTLLVVTPFVVVNSVVTVRSPLTPS
jgi:hypothetical protein